jgi:hypothetical protein
MPYITQQARDKLDAGTRPPATPGELNYKITQILLDFVGNYADYARYNAVIGVLRCAELELYRRLVAPYEDEKKEIHGDVYPTAGRA